MWLQLVEMGVIGVFFCEEDGGYGGGGFDIVVVFEEIGCGLLLEFLLGSVILVGEVIVVVGMFVQKVFLEQIIVGQMLVVLVYEEVDSYYVFMYVVMCVM